ncbi:MAG: alpha/beta fold hydrolase [Gemmatimonadota bacterium]
MTSSPAQTALQALELAQAGKFAELTERFAPQLRALVSPESFRDAWDAEVGSRGPVTAVGAPVSEPGGPGVTVVRIPLSCERGDMAVVVSVADQGWLVGVQLLPAAAAGPTGPWQPPAYADPAAFSEQEVTVGTGPLAVPGTLSLPHGPGPRPGLVLLPGSGPNDRDETIGRNKPLKDLAWGLATSGVAVLRFDKVTRAHPREVVADRGFTVSDEYVPAAVAGIRLLQQQPGVDPARVFVAGHSLGGSVAPRVAEAEPSVAGLVIMAGGAEPLHWAAVRQLRYLASLGPGRAAASEAGIEAMTRQAELIDSPGLTPDTPAADLPFGIPAPYWLDLRGYDPPAAAAAAGKRIFIAQGGRDYQATVAGDLARWQAALAGRPGVTIRVYDADNHLFFPGEGASSPAEYDPPQHMDPAVVADIAGWLLAA